MHVGIVGADVLFGAAVRHRTKAQRRVLLGRLLKLHMENRWAEINVTDGKRGVKRERENLKKKEREGDEGLQRFSLQFLLCFRDESKCHSSLKS